MSSMESSLKTYLDTALSGAYTTYIGPVRPAEPPTIPHQAIFMMRSGGLAPSPYMDGGSGTDYKMVRLQFHIRGEPDDYIGAYGIAQSVWAAMQKVPSASLFSNVRCTCDQSAPMYLGRDDLGCHEYTVNVTLEGRFSV